MYELGEFSLSHLGSTVSKHEEQCIDGIRLAGAIGPDNCRERLSEFSDDTMEREKKNLPYEKVRFPDGQRNF